VISLPPVLAAVKARPGSSEGVAASACRPALTVAPAGGQFRFAAGTKQGSAGAEPSKDRQRAAARALVGKVWSGLPERSAI